MDKARKTDDVVDDDEYADDVDEVDEQIDASKLDNPLTPDEVDEPDPNWGVHAEQDEPEQSP